MKTPEEIRELKHQWHADPCWDIEKTEGFEYHAEELLGYRNEMEAQWQGIREEELRRKAVAIGCPENLSLAKYVEFLERRIQKLEEAFNSIGQPC